MGHREAEDWRVALRVAALAPDTGMVPMRCATALAVGAEIGQLRHALAQSGKLAEDRLQQMKTDRAQALRWRDKLDRALTVCRCAARVIDSSAYQGISDEDCDLEVAVRNWRALGPNVRAKRV
jgi:hypothetical protein